MDYIANTLLLGDGVSATGQYAKVGVGGTCADSDANGTDATDCAAFNRTITGTTAYAGRHLEGANYAYADGHVKWLKPNAISDESVSASSSTTTFKVGT